MQQQNLHGRKLAILVADDFDALLLPGGALTVIRPLAFIPGFELVCFAAACDFPPA